MVLVLKWPFFCKLFFSGNIGEEQFFYDILEQKNAFLGYKNKKLENSKNCHFSKRVNPRFWSKNSCFCSFSFCCQIGQENVFYDILEGKTAFLGYKNKKFKKLKIDIFPKGLAHGFGPKMAFFPIFFF